MNKLSFALAIVLVVIGVISPIVEVPHELTPIDRQRASLSWTALPESDYVNVVTSDDTSGVAQQLMPGAINTIVIGGHSGQFFMVQEYRITGASMEPTRRWFSRVIPYRFYLPRL